MKQKKFLLAISLIAIIFAILVVIIKNNTAIKIEKASEAKDGVYIKLVRDVMNLPKYNLEVDPKPLNFFFDEENGFSIEAEDGYIETDKMLLRKFKVKRK